MTVRAVPEDIHRMLALLARPGDVFELRALSKYNGQQHIESGYFDDLDALARAAAERSGKDSGVYVTINPAKPALLARAPKNRTRRAGSGDTTSDRDVEARRHLLVDVDAERPAGISSTDAEHDAAIAMVRRIAAGLAELGWPTPIIADSGNGGHLLYAVDLPVDDGGLVRRVLAELKRRYSADGLKVDEKVFNAARISKVYGTLTRKGENTSDRPHRVARILEAPERLDVVPRELLEVFASEETPRAKATNGNTPPRANRDRPTFELDTWLSTYLPDARERPWESGRRWIVPVCPFNDQHDRGEAFVAQKHDGTLAAGCQHESCFKTWEQLRTHFEPDAYAYRDRANGNGHRITDREPPPWLDAHDGETVYRNPDYPSDVDAFAARDHEDRPAAIANGSQPNHTPPSAQPPQRVKWWRAPDLVEEIWKRKDDPWVSLSLGTDELCRVRAGGIVVVMGGPGSGKTSLVANLLVEHARHIGPSIAVSIELPGDEFGARVVGIRCDESWESALRGRIRKEFMVDALALPRLFVLEREDATIANLRLCAQAVAKEFPGQPILAAIDYAQLLTSEEREARAKVTDAFAQIDRATRAERIVTIALSQMGRASASAAASGEALGSETAALGAESAAIERFATVTMAIGKAGEIRQDGSKLVELSLGKARMSDVGDRVFPMSYFGRTGKWQTAGEAKSAAAVRVERDVEREQRLEVEINDLIVCAADRSPIPVSRDALQGQIRQGNKKRRLAAIASLVGSGRLVEVARPMRGSKGWPVWTEARALAAGAPLVRDVPTLGIQDR